MCEVLHAPNVVLYLVAKSKLTEMPRGGGGVHGPGVREGGASSDTSLSQRPRAPCSRDNIF